MANERKLDGQLTLVNLCRPLMTTPVKRGYVSRCACGYYSAVEHTKRYAEDCLAFHLERTLEESLKVARASADRSV